MDLLWLIISYIKSNQKEPIHFRGPIPIWGKKRDLHLTPCGRRFSLRHQSKACTSGNPCTAHGGFLRLVSRRLPSLQKSRQIKDQDEGTSLKVRGFPCKPTGKNEKHRTHSLRGVASQVPGAAGALGPQCFRRLPGGGGALQRAPHGTAAGGGEEPIRGSQGPGDPRGTPPKRRFVFWLSSNQPAKHTFKAICFSSYPR